MRSFGPLLDTIAVRAENMKHSDYKKGTSPTKGVARPGYTTVGLVQENHVIMYIAGMGDLQKRIDSKRSILKLLILFYRF